MNPEQGIEGLGRGPQLADGRRVPCSTPVSLPYSEQTPQSASPASHATPREEYSNRPSALVRDMRLRVARARAAAEALRQGKGVLVADDGSRENEVDFVFHAAAATAQLVNTAIRDCRGLLCVSLSPERADAMGLYTAPKTPAQVPLTGFTISVDARNSIGSGISAADRAYTIALLGQLSTKPSDLVTPGHVFPVRAADGLLCQRAGHTEAVLELCKLAQMPLAAAMCECLDENGQAVGVSAFQDGALARANPLAGLAFVSTIDLLWTRLLTEPLTAEADPCAGPTPSESVTWPGAHSLPHSEPAWTLLPISPAPYVQDLLLPCAIWLRQGADKAASTKVTWHWVGNPQAAIDRGTTSGDDQSSGEASAVVVVFDPLGHVPLPSGLNAFCDLSTKEGLGSCAPGARRLLTLLAVFETLARARDHGTKGTHDAEAKRGDLGFMRALAASLALGSDAEVITEILNLRAAKLLG